MKIILVHGIGEHRAGWGNIPKTAHHLGVNPLDIIEVVYEDLMEESWINKGLILAAKFAIASKFGQSAALAIGGDGMPDDYLNDLFVYFFGWRTREKIIQRVLDAIPEDEDRVILIGHSLGSVVAFDALRESGKEIARLYTLGSPISKATVRMLRQIKNDGGQINAHWVNVYGDKDFIGGKVKQAHINRLVNANHGYPEYVLQAKEWYFG